jgi:hypothetical protein
VVTLFRRFVSGNPQRDPLAAVIKLCQLLSRCGHPTGEVHAEALIKARALFARVASIEDVPTREMLMRTIDDVMAAAAFLDALQLPHPERQGADVCRLFADQTRAVLTALNRGGN